MQPGNPFLFLVKISRMWKKLKSPERFATLLPHDAAQSATTTTPHSQMAGTRGRDGFSSDSTGLVPNGQPAG
jgi:hypothetical protein